MTLEVDTRKDEYLRYKITPHLKRKAKEYIDKGYSVKYILDAIADDESEIIYIVGAWEF